MVILLQTQIKTVMKNKGLNKKISPDNYDTFWDWAEDNRWQIILSPVYLVFGIVAVIG